MYDNLHALLRRKNISQQKLAEHLGISPACISSRMAGRTSWQLHEAIRTLDFLGVSYSMLPEIFGDASPYEKKEAKENE